MADDADDLASRLDRIEALLRRRGATVATAAPAGPEVRSARSIVSRIDDVWVAVTEGNERVVAAIAATTGRSAPGGADQEPEAQPPGTADVETAVHALAARLDHIDATLAGLHAPSSAPLERIEAVLTRLAGSELAGEPVGPRLDRIEQAQVDLRESELAGRLGAIEQHLARAAGERPGAAAEALAATTQAIDERLARIEEALATTDAPEDDRAVHLRLNRIEEALAGVAERLAGPPSAQDAGAGGAAAAQLHADVQQLTERVEALARAVEEAAARSGDGTLTDRLGRLRDQFRR